MGKPLQIREVSDDVLEALKNKASAEHVSLAAYALRVLERDAGMLTVNEVLARPRTKAKVTKEQIAGIIRRDRESH